MRQIFCLIAALIAYGSLFPWRFVASRLHGNAFRFLLYSWPEQWHRYDVKDGLINILIYVPLGIAGALGYPAHRFLAPVAFALFLSASVEVLQQVIPTRSSSTVDIVCNTAGAAFGAALIVALQTTLWPAGARDLRTLFGRTKGALLLFTCWLATQVLRLLPDLRAAAARRNTLFYQPGADIAVDGLTILAEWVVLCKLVEALFGRVIAGRLLPILMLLIPSSWFLSGRGVAWHELIAAVCGFVVWRFLPGDVRTSKIVAIVFCFILAVRGVTPFRLADAPSSFSWVPFRALFVSEWQFALNVLARKLFDYGAPIWLLWRSGSSLPAASFAVAALLAIIEVVQRYLPGRAAEITDPLLALMLGWIFMTQDYIVSASPPAAAQSRYRR